jgi:hypothetical protein
MGVKFSCLKIPPQFVSTAVKNLFQQPSKMAGGTVPGQFVSVALKKVSAIALTFSRNNNLCPIGHKI